ncbi:MAG: hypothetical protein FWF51_09680 [Chitinivibrionia bacterium]|nr:hypothetical protein [Chitinivibrionia bacterium]
MKNQRLNNPDVKISGHIPSHIADKAKNICCNPSKMRWEKKEGLREKFYSIRLNDCYRVLWYPAKSLFIVFHHDKYERKIENLKKRGF